MRRLFLVLAVTALIAAMVAFAAPVFAQELQEEFAQEEEGEWFDESTLTDTELVDTKPSEGLIIGYGTNDDSDRFVCAGVQESESIEQSDLTFNEVQTWVEDVGGTCVEENPSPTEVDDGPIQVISTDEHGGTLTTFGKDESNDTFTCDDGKFAPIIKMTLEQAKAWLTDHKDGHCVESNPSPAEVNEGPTIHFPL